MITSVEVVAVIALAVMAATVFFEVVDRYILNLGYFWTEELARFLLVWCSLLAAVIAVDRRGHFAVTFFVERLLPRKLDPVIEVAVVICLVAATLLLSIKGWELTVSSQGEMSPALRVPMAWVFVGLPISGTLMLFTLLTQVLINLAGNEEKPRC